MLHVCLPRASGLPAARSRSGGWSLVGLPSSGFVSTCYSGGLVSLALIWHCLPCYASRNSEWLLDRIAFCYGSTRPSLGRLLSRWSARLCLVPFLFRSRVSVASRPSVGHNDRVGWVTALTFLRKCQASDAPDSFLVLRLMGTATSPSLLSFSLPRLSPGCKHDADSKGTGQCCMAGK